MRQSSNLRQYSDMPILAHRTKSTKKREIDPELIDRFRRLLAANKETRLGKKVYITHFFSIGQF